MQKKLKILFILSHLHGGGVERRTAHLLKYINRDIFEPILCLREKIGEYLADIPKDTKLFVIERRYKLVTLPRMCKMVIKEKPDIIFGVGHWGMNLIIILALKLIFFRKQRKLIIGVVNNPSSFEHQRIIRFFYSFADLIIANSQGIHKCLISSWKFPEEKIRVIHNGIDIDHIDKLSSETINHIWMKKQNSVVVSVGHFLKQKGLPYLLEALEIVNRKKKVHLIVIGRGGEEKKLKEKACEIGISDRVDFIEHQMVRLIYCSLVLPYVQSISIRKKMVIIGAMVRMNFS